jgi:protein gp37
MDNINYQEVVRMRPDADTVIRANQHIGKWGGNTVFVESALTKPLHWRKPRKIFVCSMSDLFHKSVPFEWIDRVFSVMAMCPQHEFKVLTKRAGRMRKYFVDNKAWLSKSMSGRPLPNVHLGVTVENQDNVGRIADLIATPAAKRFVSFEPLLEGVVPPAGMRSIDYAFIGCESGPRARLCDISDIRFMMAQCKFAGVKRHIKQIPHNGKCNKNIEEWPDEFRVREI